MNYDNQAQQINPHAQKLNEALQQGAQRAAQPPRDKPLMEVEYEHLSDSIGELDISVTQLIASIAPVCQPGSLDKLAQCGESKAIEATPSELRGKLLKLRLRVEAISAKISPIRYTLEI